MINLSDIRLKLDRQSVLKGFDLDAESACVSLVVGPNGAGKSSSLKVACGLWRPSSGAVLVDGRDITDCPREYRKYVAYLPQSPSFHPRLTVAQVAEFYARIERCSPDEVEYALECFGMDACSGKRTGNLSGGFRQRLGLAVLSLSKAPVLLLDEPGLSLDPFWRERLQEWLREEAASGRTLIVATHLLAEWEGKADRCFLCDDGRIVGQLNPEYLRQAFPAPLDQRERKVAND
ncbi:ABC transporter ATP-binding protein [Puniceicoccales bacterium CK1056]|uniref:ABC transporter ATP-binding protein n=1 Tax=Oceanipulchritudo coccoides TaxID=2706888 RepID=A0A6B2M023_9BACT|nr:ABC transporter ATP-binding protein [Oceanipulchritudo coccoides]NDV61110.1 ABC transporter ATP-binding protein [Oceanipulchritudo coccoides]